MSRPRLLDLFAGASVSPTPTDGERLTDEEIGAATRAIVAMRASSKFRAIAVAALQAAADCPDGTVARLTRERDEALEALRKVRANYTVAQRQASAFDKSVGTQWKNVAFVVSQALAQKDTP